MDIHWGEFYQAFSILERRLDWDGIDIDSSSEYLLLLDRYKVKKEKVRAISQAGQRYEFIQREVYLREKSLIPSVAFLPKAATMPSVNALYAIAMTNSTELFKLTVKLFRCEISQSELMREKKRILSAAHA